MEYDILLNFVPLKDQEFTFTVFRKESKGETKSQFGDNDIYSNWLPINSDNLNNGKIYWISFTQKDDFEKFICKPEYNNKLTLHYLYYCLIKKIKATLSSGEFVVPKNKFHKIVYFILKRHEKKEKNVCYFPLIICLPRKNLDLLLISNS